MKNWVRGIWISICSGVEATRLSSVGPGSLIRTLQHLSNGVTINGAGIPVRISSSDVRGAIEIDVPHANVSQCMGRAVGPSEIIKPARRATRT
jgi:hypothetical protein